MNFKQEIKAGKLGQQIQIPIAKFDYQDPMIEETQLPKVSLWPPHAMLYTQTF